MGNTNNTQIEYWTKSGHKISYLFWDLKGRNRFPEQPSDPQISALFNKCLSEIDISSYQLKAIQQFTPKYKYRFVVLHKRRVKQLAKQQEIMKYSKELHQTQLSEGANTMQSKKKIQQLQKLLMNIQLNQTSIKTTLIELQKFISEEQYINVKNRFAQNEFIQIKGIERILGHLDAAIKMNEKGTKTSFSSQIQLLKFLRIFSDRFPKLFYHYLPHIRSYAMTILQSYHPINTQIIAYSLSLLSDFAWRVEPQHEQDSLVQVLQKYKKQMNMQSFLSPFIESIIESESIVNVYHNIKFVNELMASVMGKKDKELLEETLRRVQYGVVLENVKLRLQAMYYSIEKTTFIAIYQKIFKHALANTTKKHRIDQIIEQNYRNSVLANHRNSLQVLHQQAIASLIQTQSQLELQNSQLDLQSSNQLVTYLGDNDRRQFNKVVFDTLTEMQKYYKLQFYLQTTHEMQQSSIDSDHQKAKQLIDDRIIQHNIETYFHKIKRQSSQNKSIEILNSCLQKIQSFTIQQWRELEKWIYQGSQEIIEMKNEMQALKGQLEEKKGKIKMLIKENNQLKSSKNQQVEKESLQSNALKSPPSLQEALNTNALKSPPSLQDALKMNAQNTTNDPNSTFLIPPPPPLPLGLPTIPMLNIALSAKQKPKRQPPKPLKACNYTTIAYDKIKDSIFEQIDDTTVKIDQNQLAQLFAKNNQSKSQSSKLQRSTLLQTIVNGARSERLTLPGSFQETVQLLRPDRAKNIEIVLTKLKIPKGQFRKVLIECSGGKFMSHHTLQAVQKILPTEQEQQLISSFEGNEKDLGVSEKFLTQLISVPEYASRIRVMLFSHENEQIYHEIESKIEQLSKGFKSLKDNSRLKCVLENCLAIGNFLNGQSVKGGAWGFRLETIQRLEQVKTPDGKMNAALYLIKQLWKHYEYPIFDRQEIQLYQYLAKMPLSQVKHQIDKLQGFMNAMIKASKSKDESNDKDKIDVFCSSFQQTISTKLQQFKTQFEQIKDLFVKCATYYCEDSKTLASDEFGKKMYQCILFISNTQKMYKVIEEQNIRSSKYRASTKSVSYRQSANPQKFRESLIDIRQEDGFQIEKHDEGLSKTTPLVLQSGKKREDRVSFKKKQSVSSTIHLAELNEPQAIMPITHSNERASHRLSFIFQIHKPTKPLQQLSHEQIQTQLKAIQREALDREMESMIRRRTQKFQMITAKFNKPNGLTPADNKIEVEQKKNLLKNA